VVVGAGARIGRLISVLSRRPLAGYEFLAGIPGTVGGALAMNAGARLDFKEASSYREMKDIVDWVEVLDDRGKARRFLRDEIEFGYRRSSLKGCVIVRAQLRLERAVRSAVEARLRKLLAQRLARQDWRYPSAGSFFKNPSPAQPAGKLIDRCGLKGLRVGGAQVSDRHANFIVNVGRATSADVLKLMEIVRKRVYNRFQINLQPEVEFVG
jgi:UDP-N-acetylmuramate dehydrogenase